MYSGHSEYINFADIHSTLCIYKCTIWGHWNFRLFVMPHTSQHTQDLPNLSDDCDLWNHPVFWLLLAPCRLVGLSNFNIAWSSFLTQTTAFSAVHGCMSGFLFNISEKQFLSFLLIECSLHGQISQINCHHSLGLLAGLFTVLAWEGGEWLVKTLQPHS